MENLNTLNVNKQFKEKFEHEQKRKILDQVKVKYGRELLSASSESDSESEDSEAEFVNKNVITKFVNVLTSLKDEKKKKELLNNKNNLFDDEDFKVDDKAEAKAKPYTIKDVIIDGANDKDDFEKEPENFEDLDYIPVKKNDKFKESFLKAAASNFNGPKGDDFVDDGLITKKSTKASESVKPLAKPKKRITLNDKPLEELDYNDLVKFAGPDCDDKVLLDYWEKTKDTASSRDKFLRNYILTEAWKDKSSNTNVTFTKEDEEDDEKSDLCDNFEAAFNFRYQESGGINITTHKRVVEDQSMRIKDNSRAEKRKEAEQRKKDEKDAKIKELNMVRQIQKEEYSEKVDQFLKMAGKQRNEISDKLLDKIYKELDAEDFSSDRLDAIMDEIFNSNYYKLRNTHDEEKLVEKELLNDEETRREIEDELNNDNNNNNNNIKSSSRKGSHVSGNNINEDYELNDNKNINENINENSNEDEESETEWWFCDACKIVIKPGKTMYVSVTPNTDYTLCKACEKNDANKLKYKLKKKRVPLNTKVIYTTYII